MAQFLPLILLAGVMYVALVLPQQRRTKEHRALLSALEDGDEVVLNSGIHGFITQLDSDVVWVEVAPNVELKVSRSAIATKVRVVDEPEPTGDKGPATRAPSDKAPLDKPPSDKGVDRDKAEG